MTEIQQNSLTSGHLIDDALSHSGKRYERDSEHSGLVTGDNTQDLNSSTVNISYHAQMRLKAYQEHKSTNIEQSSQGESLKLKTRMAPQPAITERDARGFSKPEEPQFETLLPEKISAMLTEVENNLVQNTEPGYRHLVNMLFNHRDRVSDPQQLQDIMRKEQFYLTRRKAFMESSDFQSYSQVLNQFSNIVAR